MGYETTSPDQPPLVITVGYAPDPQALRQTQQLSSMIPPLALLGALAIIVSETDWSKLSESAREDLRTVGEWIRDTWPAGYGHTGSKPDTSSPPSTQTPIDTLPGGTADNSGAVGQLPGGSSVVQTPEDFVVTTPGVQKPAHEYIFLQTETVFEKKIVDTMTGRGWTKEGIQNLINNPDKVYAGRDTRWNEDGITKRNDPATIYVDGADNYVTRNDVDGTIVQVSNKFKSGWKKPWEK